MVVSVEPISRPRHQFIRRASYAIVLYLGLRHHLTVAPLAESTKNQKIKSDMFISRYPRKRIEGRISQCLPKVNQTGVSRLLKPTYDPTQLLIFHDKLLDSKSVSRLKTNSSRKCHFHHYSSNSNDPDPNIEEQRRKTNLGAMMDLLKLFVPTLLQESLPAEMLLSNVLLRICPSHFENINAYLPNIKGHVSYYATCKALQIFLTSLVLNPRTELHILLIRTSRFPEPNCMYEHSTKIHIRWTTCPEGCWHLSGSPKLVSLQTNDDTTDASTSNAKLGSHRWSSIDPGKLLDALDLNWSLTGALANLGKGIVGLRKEDDKLERIISGVFIFELNESNDQITVHTVEDMEVVERPEEQGELRVC